MGKPNFTEPASDGMPGVTVTNDVPTGIEYAGSEADLLAAGLIEPGWLDGLGSYRRQIARVPGKGWEIIGEGKGNRVNNGYKEAGAYSVSRRRDGLFAVFVYRGPAECRALQAAYKAERDAEYDAWRAEQRAEQEKQAWQHAKTAHSDDHLQADYVRNLIRKAEEIAGLVSGELVYQDTPRIGFGPAEVERSKAIITELVGMLKRAKPVILDRQRENNVYSLDGRAYNHLKA